MSNSIKKVSVIIPTYNRARFLPDAVKSILAQNYDNLEIIIVDDNSDDNTTEVVTKLKEQCPDIRFYINERSMGPSGSRNTGIQKSTGNYLAFLDSDDVWLEGHLIHGLKIFDKHPEIDVLFGNFNIVDFDSGKILYDFFSQKKILHTLKFKQITSNIKLIQDDLFIALIKENFFSLCSLIIKKSRCRNIYFNENVMFAEDRDFAIKLYKNANATFAFREDPVFNAYRHDSNICNRADIDNKKNIVNAHAYLFSQYLRTYKLSSEEKKLLNKIIADKYSNASFNCWIKKEYQKYLSYMLNSFKYNITFSQFRNLFKVMIYPLIRSRYKKLST